MGGTSRTSPHSAGSPVSSGPGQYPLSHQPNKRASQLSAYEKQGYLIVFNFFFFYCKSLLKYFFFWKNLSLERLKFGFIVRLRQIFFSPALCHFFEINAYFC